MTDPQAMHIIKVAGAIVLSVLALGALLRLVAVMLLAIANWRK